MKKNAEFQMDARGIDNLMRGYSGEHAAHFGFIAQEDGKRQFFAGGRADITSICIAEAMANFVIITPDIPDDFIDATAQMAKEMLRMMRDKQTQ